MDVKVGLITAAVIVVLVLTAGFFLAPDAVSEKTPEEPSRIDVTDVEIKPQSVSGRTATLEVRTRLNNRGGSAENTSVEYSATDDESGFLETTVMKKVGTVTDDRERTVSANLTVDRKNGVVIETIVYVDGKRDEESRRRVSGLEALTPDFAKSDIEFHKFTDQPKVQYSIDSVDGDEVSLNVSTYLTNVGDESNSGLSIEMKARQLESGIIADTDTVRTNRIGPGETHEIHGNLKVPDGYNYRLDALLWKDDVLVGTTSGFAKLDPKKTVPENATEEDVKLKVDEFRKDRDRRPDRTVPHRNQSSEQGAAGRGQPGFGLLAAVFATSLAVYIRRRKR
ncbi:MAG: PGF-CTERM sorting domain-containing protein [Halobacteria archaeon]